MPTLVLTAPPAIEPVTVSQSQRHLRLDAASAEPVPVALAVALSGAGAGNVDGGGHRYRCTFVTADGETDGGTVSEPGTIVGPADVGGAGDARGPGGRRAGATLHDPDRRQSSDGAPDLPDRGRRRELFPAGH